METASNLVCCVHLGVSGLSKMEIRVLYMFVYENLRGRYNDDYRDEEDYLSRPLRADLRRLSCLITTLSSPLSHVEKGFDPAATRATMRDLS